MNVQFYLKREKILKFLIFLRNKMTVFDDAVNGYAELSKEFKEMVLN